VEKWQECSTLKGGTAYRTPTQIYQQAKQALLEGKFELPKLQNLLKVTRSFLTLKLLALLP